VVVLLLLLLLLLLLPLPAPPPSPPLACSACSACDDGYRRNGDRRCLLCLLREPFPEECFFSMLSISLLP
jgi:hypothetical protein